ncbi:nascent polypeptide-associated complex subunit alpha, muscle-specific form-like [Chrysemys picta bellii]|uniref:nascent polypeptide-associated complex subunit alpha, muscle-specific form-like n=1 Tax=Chrysemys picta bellii TaxID=8478 RepID=UPI0032B1ACFD
MEGNTVGEPPQVGPATPPPPVPLASTSTSATEPPATTAALAAAGDGVTSAAATSLAPSNYGGAAPAGRKGQGKKKGKSPAKKTGPSMAGAASTAAAPPPAAASLPAAPSTSSAGAPPPGPRAYAQVAAATGMPSRPSTASASNYSGLGPFPTLTRRHGIRCLQVSASPHVETYVRALARVVGPAAIVAASKMYGKVVFFLASEAAAQEAVEKGLAVGGVFVPLEPLEDLGVRVVLTSVPPYLPNVALLPALSTLGKPISIVRPLSLGCKDPALRHVLSFRRHVQLQLPPAARAGEALEGSFLVPYRGTHCRVYYSTGEARCYLCRAIGHVRRDCPLARHGGASGTPEPRQSASPTIAGAPSCPVPGAAPPPSRTTTAPARAQGVSPPPCPDERESPVSALCTVAGPVEEGAVGVLPGAREGPPQGDSPPPPTAPLLPPQVLKPSSLPPDPIPVTQPADDAMEGWTLVQGKRGKRKARAPLLPSGAEAPRKTRKGGSAAEPSALPAGALHLPLPVGEAVAAPEDAAIHSPRSFLAEAHVAAPPTPLPPIPSAMLEASVASGVSRDDPGVVGGELPSIYEEIEALGLTPVTQGEDDPLPAGLDLAALTSTLPSASPVPLTAAPAFEEPLDSLPCPAAGAASLTAAEPLQATAGASRPGLELPGVSLVGVGQPSSFPSGGPTADCSPSAAVAVPSATVVTLQVEKLL